jgi:hypothetical protein
VPYSPGVQDISGQLRAEGKRARTTGIAQGALGGFQEYSQNKIRNSVLQGENEGLLKAFMSDPETAKYAPADLEKFIEKTQKGGGLSLKDNIQMNGMLNATLKTRGVIEQQKEAQQMQKVREQEMKARALQIQSAQQEQEAVSRLQRLAQSQQGVGSGVLRADVQDRNAEQLKDPLTQFAIQKLQATGRPLSDSDLREFMQNRGGGAPTTAMRDTGAIIASELAAGKLKPEQVEGRKAELLAAGGRDPGDIYDNAGTYVDAKSGSNARAAVKVRRGDNAGMIVFRNPDGTTEPVDPKKWKPSTVGDTNPLLDPPGMEKLRERVLADERSVRQLGRYLGGFENLEQGVGQLADRAAKSIKTIFTKEPLTEEEKAVGVQQGRLQAILGSLRTAIVGPGVMTEQDAQRIVDALGGDVSALQNQEVVSSLIGEILQEKLNEYESDLDIYNTQVVKKYGEAGYKQREKVVLDFKKKKEAEKLSEPAGAIQIKSIRRID